MLLCLQPDSDSALCARVVEVRPAQGEPLHPILILQSPSGTVEEVLEYIRLGASPPDGAGATGSLSKQGQWTAARPGGPLQATGSGPGAFGQPEQNGSRRYRDGGREGHGRSRWQEQDRAERALLRGTVDLLAVHLHGDGEALKDAPHRRLSESQVHDTLPVNATYSYTSTHHTATGTTRAAYRALAISPDLSRWSYRRKLAFGSPAGASDDHARTPSAASHVRTYLEYEHVVEFDRGGGRAASASAAANRQLPEGGTGRDSEPVSEPPQSWHRVVSVTARGRALMYGTAAATPRGNRRFGVGSAHFRGFQDQPPLLAAGGETIVHSSLQRVRSETGPEWGATSSSNTASGAAAVATAAAALARFSATYGTFPGFGLCGHAFLQVCSLPYDSMIRRFGLSCKCTFKLCHWHCCDCAGRSHSLCVELRLHGHRGVLCPVH